MPKKTIWKNFCYLTVTKQGWIPQEEIAEKLLKGKFYAYYKGALKESKKTGNRILRVDWQEKVKQK